jgi:hypothetical protein
VYSASELILWPWKKLDKSRFCALGLLDEFGPMSYHFEDLKSSVFLGVDFGPHPDGFGPKCRNPKNDQQGRFHQQVLLTKTYRFKLKPKKLDCLWQHYANKNVKKATY